MKISVIVPVYNQRKYLEYALNSLLSQKIPRSEYEIIIINDGSTDNSQTIIEYFYDEIVLINHDENKGLVKSLNDGLEVAIGDYVIRLDSDDLMDDSSLLIQSAILDSNPDIDFVVTDRFENGKHVNIQLDDITTWVGCGYMYRRRILDYIDGFHDCFWEEHDLHLRLIDDGCKYFYLPLALYYYRQHGENMTSDTEKVTYEMEMFKIERGDSIFTSGEKGKW